MCCCSVQDDSWNVDGAVLVDFRIRKASLDGRLKGACDLAACDGFHYACD